MNARLLTISVLAALVIGGCDSDTEEPSYPRDASAEDQIRAVVDYFNLAAEDLDGGVLCRQVLAPSTRPPSCEEQIDGAMEDAPENWNAVTDVLRIDATGGSATATGRQEGESLSIDFVREDGRWWMQVFD